MGHFLDTEEHRQQLHDLFPGMQLSEEGNTLFVDNGSGEGPVPWLSFGEQKPPSVIEEPSLSPYEKEEQERHAQLMKEWGTVCYVDEPQPVLTEQEFWANVLTRKHLEWRDVFVFACGIMLNIGLHTRRVERHVEYPPVRLSLGLPPDHTLTSEQEQCVRDIEAYIRQRMDEEWWPDEVRALWDESIGRNRKENTSPHDAE